MESGTVRPGRAGDLGRRLSVIYKKIGEVVDRCEPEAASFEEIFHHKNVRSVILLAHARGAAMLAVSEKHIPVFEYSPTNVKSAVVGYGRAEKSQVQKMLPHLMKMETPPDSADAADALAIACCHAAHTSSIAAAAKGRR